VKWSIVLFLSLSATSFADCFLDQSYGPEPQHTYDLCIGQSETLLVLVHGGGWVKGDKRADNFDYGDAVSYVSERYGLSVASVNYTLATENTPTAPLNINGPKPRPTHNVMIAVSKIKVKSGAHRVVLLGTSAGANIAALTYAYYKDDIDGFIGFYGAYDLKWSNDFHPVVQDMIDVYTGGSDAKELTASPSKIRFPDKKYLLYHGELDTVVNPMQSIAMENAKPGAELHLVEGEGHGFKVFGEKDDPAPWVERLIRFIYTGE